MAESMLPTAGEQSLVPMRQSGERERDTFRAIGSRSNQRQWEKAKPLPRG
jgi:hypothetical protein